MTLLMRDQENLERGIEKGLEKGLEKGIECTILICRDLGMKDEAILKQLQEKFHLTKSAARRYIKEIY